MTSDDANALPLQPEGFSNQTQSTTDPSSERNSERLEFVITDAQSLDQVATEPSLQEPEIVSQPAPPQCNVCGRSHWELYAHLPIETDAYLTAVAELNRRSRTKKRKPPKATVAPARSVSLSTTETLPLDASEPEGNVSEMGREIADTADTGDTANTANTANTAATPEERDSQASETLSESLLTGDQADLTVINLAMFPHGTAWRCYDCGALSLVWPIENEPIAETIEPPTRRRSSAEFRDGIKPQIDRCLRTKATDAHPALTLKRLRVLDLNLGRGTRADRNLALLHDLGLAKHQIFGLGDDRSTVDRLNFAGYQVYYGTIDSVDSVDSAIDELPDNYFDLVLGFNVIEYLPNPSLTIQRLTAKLRPGARFLLELSNPESWQAQLFRHGYWASYQRDRCVLFGEKALRVLGERCNLTIDDLKAYPEPQAWETSAAAWIRRKRHPLRGAMGSGLVRGTLIGIDRLRAALGMKASRYGAVLVFHESSSPSSPSSLNAPSSPIAPNLAPEFGTNPTDE